MYNPTVPFKDEEAQRAYQRRWAADRRSERAAAKGVRRRAVAGAINDLKVRKGCSRCGYDRCAAALELHHVGRVRPLKKSISDAIRAGHTLEAILDDAEACQVLCANCHREEHEDDYQAGVWNDPAVAIAPLQSLF